MRRAKIGILIKEFDEAFFGAKHIMLELGTPFDTITSEDQLCEYSLILVPSVSYLNGKQDVLSDYLKNGGKIIACGGVKDCNTLNILGFKIKKVLQNEEVTLELNNSHPILSNIYLDEITISGDILLVEPSELQNSIGNLIFDDNKYLGIITDPERRFIFFPFELCKLIIQWETETYALPSDITFSMKLMQKLYYNLPPAIQYLIWKTARIIRLRKRKEIKKFTNWPIDHNSDTLRKLLKNSILFEQENHESLNLTPKWPKGFRAALVITHDVDSKRGYKEGLPKIVEIERKYNVRSTWNFIARSREYELNTELLQEMISDGFEIASHGLYHDGLLDTLSIVERKDRLLKSKEIIESFIQNYKIEGFRSPRLIRTNDLWKLLQEVGYTYDMSFPDVDHTTNSRFGMGVSANIPYNPVIKNADLYKELDIVELPLTVPQDTELFVDRKMPAEKALKIWKQKGDHVISLGGLIVFLFHPYYFVDKSHINMYENFLEYFTSKENLWITTARDAVEFWNHRKNIITKRENKNGK